MQLYIALDSLSNSTQHQWANARNHEKETKRGRDAGKWQSSEKEKGYEACPADTPSPPTAILLILCS
eukprot:3935153-Amphidinium_carterae.2